MTLRCALCAGCTWSGSAGLAFWAQFFTNAVAALATASAVRISSVFLAFGLQSLLLLRPSSERECSKSLTRKRRRKSPARAFCAHKPREFYPRSPPAHDAIVFASAARPQTRTSKSLFCRSARSPCCPAGTNPCGNPAAAIAIPTVIAYSSCLRLAPFAAPLVLFPLRAVSRPLAVPSVLFPLLRAASAAPKHVCHPRCRQWFITGPSPTAHPLALALLPPLALFPATWQWTCRRPAPCAGGELVARNLFAHAHIVDGSGERALPMSRARALEWGPRDTGGMPTPLSLRGPCCNHATNRSDCGRIFQV